MPDFQIFTDATTDLAETLPELKVIPMRVEIGGKDHLYGPGGDITAQDIYRMQREGYFASTSQINPTDYCRYFEPILQEGKDILYLSVSSGMSSTYQSSLIAAEELKETYPGRKVRCVDSLGATVGELLMPREAFRLRGEGRSLDDVADWLEEHRL